MLAAAGIVVYAAQFSDFGSGGTTGVRLDAAPPPAAASPIAVRLANAIGRANLGRRFRAVDMAKVAPFRWERVYVFANEASDDIKRRLGFDWTGAPETVPRSGQHESLLAFVRGGQVAGSAFFSDAIGHLDCLTAEGGYPRGTRFVVRYTRNDHAPYLATTRPDAADAACLHAVAAVTH
ncbi:MAG TPA: hypothetical protein VGI67_22620 [Thermoleophilaceae bacterium]